MTIIATVAGIAAAALVQNGPPAVDADQLATCMMTNTTPSIEQSTKDMIVSALTEDRPGFDQAATALAFNMLEVMTQKCGITMATIETPQVQIGLEIYGERLGMKIFEEALARMMAPTTPYVMAPVDFSHFVFETGEDANGEPVVTNVTYRPD